MGLQFNPLVVSSIKTLDLMIFKGLINSAFQQRGRKKAVMREGIGLHP